MPLDPIIANPTMAKFADPSETYGNALKNAFLAQQIDEARTKRDDTNMMRKAMSEVGDPALDERTNVRNNLRKFGRADLTPAYDKTNAEIDFKKAEGKKLEVEASKARVEKLGKALENYKTMYEGVSDDPNVGQHQLFSIFQKEAKDDDVKDFLGPDHVAEASAALHAAMVSPDAYKKFLMEKKMGAKAAAEATKRTFEALNLGGDTKVVSLDPTSPDGDAKLAAQFHHTPDPNKKDFNIVVHAEQKAADVYEEGRKKHQADVENAKQDIAEAAPQAIAEIQRMRALFKSGKPLTGTGASTFEKLASMGKTVGVDVIPPDRLQATQEARIFLSTTMLQNIAQLRHSGVALGAITEKEFEQLMASAPKITDQPEVIDAWLARAENNYRRMAQEFNTTNAQRMANPHTRPYEQAVPPNNIPMTGGQPPAPPNPPAGPQTPTVLKAHSNDAGFKQIVELLKQGRVSREGFDRKYGPGAAAQVLGQPGGGGTPTGGTPFPPGR